MEAVSNLVKQTLPAYLQGLPIPNTIMGWFSISIRDWVRLVPFGVTVGGLSYLTIQGLANAPVIGPLLKEKLSNIPGFSPHTQVNKCIKKECAKVVDTIDMEDIGDKVVLCRCWQSKKFPYCDGSHTKHNLVTGDNVGPLIVKK